MTTLDQKQSLKWIFASISITLMFILFPGCGRLRRPPNVLLISIDTLRADHLGCYGYEKDKDITPNLDALSHESIKFDRTIAQAPSTLPSHASIFTSMIPSHHGAFFTRKAAISSNTPTLTECLKDQGYATVSWNGGGQVAAEYGIAKGFDLYQEKSGANFPEIVTPAIEWLDTHRQEPFFMFLHTYQVHHPYTPDTGDLAFVEGVYTGSLPSHTSVELLKDINKGRRTITPADQQHIIYTYDAEIHAMDRTLGKLIAYLKEHNLYDNTLIVFTADHGEEFNEHGKMGWHSHTLFDELLHVPWMMKLPGKRFGGMVIEEQVRSIDIAPTILDAIDVPLKSKVEGQSLMAWIEKGEREVLPAISQRDLPHRLPTSLRMPDFKIIQNQIYDLANDPGETVNLRKERPEIFTALADMRQAILQQHPIEGSPGTAVTTPETEKTLRSLGYIK